MKKALIGFSIVLGVMGVSLLFGSYAYFRGTQSSLRGFDYSAVSAPDANSPEIYIEINPDFEPLFPFYNALGSIEGSITGNRVAVRMRIFTRHFL